jgi:hypothetical protein
MAPSGLGVGIWILSSNASSKGPPTSGTPNHLISVKSVCRTTVSRFQRPRSAPRPYLGTNVCHSSSLTQMNRGFGDLKTRRRAATDFAADLTRFLARLGLGTGQFWAFFSSRRRSAGASFRRFVCENPAVWDATQLHWHGEGGPFKKRSPTRLSSPNGATPRLDGRKRYWTDGGDRFLFWTSTIVGNELFSAFTQTASNDTPKTKRL